MYFFKFNLHSLKVIFKSLQSENDIHNISFIRAWYNVHRV